MIEPWIIQLVAQALLTGAAWGHLRWGQTQNRDDISSVKKALGLENGNPGVFMRTREWEISEEAKNARLDRIEYAITALRENR